MEKGSAQTIYTLLDRLGVAYTHTTHHAAMTMDDLAGIPETLGAAFCKNLFLCNRQKTEHFLLLLSGEKRFRTAEVSKAIGRARLSFGDESALYDMLGVRPGAVTPMGLIFDAEKRVHVLIDRDVLKSERFCVHPCVNTESLALRTDDFMHVFLPFTGHVPTLIDVTGRDE